MKPVTVQAPPVWKGRTLTACDPASGPFRAMFDDQAQASLLPSQAAHLCAVSGEGFTIIAPLDDPGEALPSRDVRVAFPEEMPGRKTPSRRKKGS